MADKFANTLRFCTPAQWWGEKWREGLFLGNGKIGANVYGGASEEKILLNDAALSWLGRTTVVPDVSVKLKDVRKKIDNGDFVAAQSVLQKALEQKNFRPQIDYPLPMCELNLSFEQAAVTTEFMRALDMEKGEVTVSYAIDGTKYKRTCFVSRADNVVVYRVTKQGTGAISLHLGFDLMHRVNARTYDGVCNMPEGISTKYDKQFAAFFARNDDNNTDYGAVARLSVLGGTVRADDDGVEISGAQSLTILIKTFTNGSREREFSALKQQLTALKDPYDKMFKTHATMHQKLYSSCEISLSKMDDRLMEELLLEARAGELPPMLAEKLYKFARYLTVAGNAEGGGLLGPSGLWNGSYKPFRAFISASGELEMTYLHTLQGNLAFNLEKSFEYYERNMDDYRNNAQRIFGCRGIVVPVVSAPNTGRLGSLDVFAIHFTGCAAWIAGLYYKFARYTQNTKFLKSKLIPFMKEIAAFYEDFITVTNSGAEISPSALPMRVDDSIKVTDRPVIAKNSTLDFSLAKDLLTNLADACEDLNVKGDVNGWRNLASAIPQKQLASDNTFKEFVNSIISVDYTGISNGTLYDAYFGDSVSTLSDEETVAQYLATADKKLSSPAEQNSFNTLVLGAVYARLGNAENAKQCLTNAVRGAALDNLTFADKDWRGMGICGSGMWTPIQLNANMVFANDVQQMLMYSHGEVVKLFPALPSDWKYVKFDGMLAENGVVVSASLDADKGLFSVKLEAKNATPVKLMLPDSIKKLVKTNLPEKPVGKVVDCTVPAGKSVELQYKIKL